MWILIVLGLSLVVQCAIWWSINSGNDFQIELLKAANETNQHLCNTNAYLNRLVARGDQHLYTGDRQNEA